MNIHFSNGLSKVKKLVHFSFYLFSLPSSPRELEEGEGEESMKKQLLSPCPCPLSHNQARAGEERR